MSCKRAWSILLMLGSLAIDSVAQQAQSAASTISDSVVPCLSKFSGTLKDASGKPLSEITGVTFSRYKDEVGGAPLWMEVQNVQPDKNGHYSVILGSMKSSGLPVDIFASGEARWLGVQPAGQEEQPRVLLMSVPYALKAQDAATIGGLPPSAFVLANQEVSPESHSVEDLAAVPTGYPHGNFELAPPVTTYTAVKTSNPPGGSVGYLPLWTQAPNVIGNSHIFQSTGGFLGIGTTSPGTLLEVQGANANNLGPSVTITNNASGPGTGASLDFNTFSPKYGPGYNPTSRILASDDGHYSTNLTFEANNPGAQNNGLLPVMSINSNGGVVMDASGANQGNLTPGILFGADTSGEGIASARTASSPNQFGLDFYTNFQKRMGISQSGSVYIGPAPTETGIIFSIGHGLGYAVADGWGIYSSRRWKTNIHTLHGALDQVERLRGVSYDLKDSGKHQIGVIAEEVGAVVPEVVEWETNGKDAKAVDYARLTALLIEATKEQQEMIRSEQKLVRSQQKQILSQRKQLAAQRIQMNIDESRIAQLASQVKTVQATLTSNGQLAASRSVSAQLASLP